MSLSKKSHPPLQTEIWARCQGGRISSHSREIVYSFNFLFDIFWCSIYLIHVPQFGREDLVYDYLFTCQRESHSVPDIDFFVITSLILSSQFELPKIKLRSILMKNYDHSIYLGWSFLSLYALAKKTWLLQYFIF